MQFSLSTELIGQLALIKKKDLQLFKKIQKQLKLFLADHKHPSLRTHKLKGELAGQWSISIKSDIRILFYISKGEAVFYTIGTHDQVYRIK
jgi:mRNA-degrading endonuclease YafQ of YafQ-DinJ toxin-antitoxin module